MNVYNNLNQALGIEVDGCLTGDFINFENNNGWNNCKAHSISVSIGMKEMWETEHGHALRKKKSSDFRGDERFSVCGNLGKKHTEETKKKQSVGANRRMTDEQKQEAISLYAQGIGIKTISKKIGFSATAIRKFLRKQ